MEPKIKPIQARVWVGTKAKCGDKISYVIVRSRYNKQTNKQTKNKENPSALTDEIRHYIPKVEILRNSEFPPLSTENYMSFLTIRITQVGGE